MLEIKIPYGDTSQVLNIKEDKLKKVIKPKTIEKDTLSEEEILVNALNNPINSYKINELVKGKNSITIVTSDHTRAVPSKKMLSLLLKQIRESNPNIKVTLLIGTGLHRPTTIQEQINMFGEDIVKNERIVVNNAFNKEDFEYVCNLPSGSKLWVNKEALNCDILISIGLIEPHFFAGYSGGRKSILPGICNEVTVNENHSYKAISSPYAKTGIMKNNPINEDMLYAAKAVKLAFIFNVIIDENKKIIAAFSGDSEKAHEKGIEFLEKMFLCEKENADIVITSNGGYPLDQNLYQTPKSASTAEACVNDGGVIILVSECKEGFGGTNFSKLICSGKPEEIDEKLKNIEPEKSISEQWCAQIFSRILLKSKIILVSSMKDEEVTKANMIPASNVNEALSKAYNILDNKKSMVVVIPDGVSTLIK